MPGAMRFIPYEWPGGHEQALRIGPDDAPLVAIAPALFEEANRTRAFTVQVMRRLAASGIATLLPDLPGTGESVVATSAATLAGWRTAFAAAAAGAMATLAIRGGALVTTGVALPALQFVPVPGSALVRDMERARRVAGHHAGIDDADPVELAGNLLSRTLIAELRIAEPPPADRIVAVSAPGAPGPAIAGRPLWRSSEPSGDDVMAAALAAEVEEWMSSRVA